MRDYATPRAKRWALCLAGQLPAHIVHGLNTYNNWGCRCDICYTAKSDNNRATYETRHRKPKQKESA